MQHPSKCILNSLAQQAQMQKSCSEFSRGKGRGRMVGLYLCKHVCLLPLWMPWGAEISTGLADLTEGRGREMTYPLKGQLKA